MNSISIIIHCLIIFIIVVYIFLYTKEKIKGVMFHPLIAIIIGMMVTIEMFVASQAFFVYIHLSQFLAFPITVFIGSLVATLISKKNTLLIGILIGIIFALFVSIIVLIYGSIFVDFYYNILFMAVVLVLSLISGGIGGYMAQMIKKRNK